MKPELKIEKITLQDGREIILETGLLAKQSHGSCVVRMGNTMLLATVVSSKEAKDGTIRKKFGISIDKNSVHVSYSVENAKIEIKFFFAVFSYFAYGFNSIRLPTFFSCCM